MRTANPALRDSALNQVRRPTALGVPSQTMTVQGAVNKTLVLVFLLVLSAAFVWRLALTAGGYGEVVMALEPSRLMPWVWAGGIGGFIVALATVFKPTWAPVTAPLYSVLEGLLIGGLSLLMEATYPGIVMQAAFLTVGTLVSLLLAYKSGYVRVTERFRAGVVAATGGIALVYIVSMVLGFFGVAVPFLHNSSPLSIGISAVVIVVAALNLVLDFDFIEQGAARGAPKYMEWYGGFALLVTLVWLYVEFLRLLAKLNDRRS